VRTGPKHRTNRAPSDGSEEQNPPTIAHYFIQRTRGNRCSTRAINIAISERELDGIRKNISSDHNDMLHEKGDRGNDSPSKELQYTIKSADVIGPNRGFKKL
ncbi:hypothetical protein H5410_039380, partial [Solanum commersonii]